MENYQNLIQQAEIAISKNDFLTAENLYFAIYKTAEKNLDFAVIFWALQKIMEIFPTKFKAKIIKNYFAYFMSSLSESAENENFQKLQNALRNQQNQNLNLQMMLAKILIFQAQKTQNFTEEYQKLLMAKNLIRNLDFEYANYYKSQIELYLAKNSKKILPPPPILTIKYTTKVVFKNFPREIQKNF